MKQQKKRIFGILLSFALMLTMMPVLGLSLTAYAEPDTYNLWVGGKQVTDGNKDNVLADDSVNDGRVSFTPAEGENPATLTLDGATITKGYSGRNIHSDIRGLTIEVKGENSLTGGIMGIESTKDFTITGDGSLQAEGSDRGPHLLCHRLRLFPGGFRYCGRAHRQASCGPEENGRHTP